MMLVVGEAGAVVNADAELDVDYDVRAWVFQPDPDDLMQLAEGARIVVALACIEVPQLQAKVAAPLCECGCDMRWEPRLKTFACEHEEGDDSPV